MNRRTHGGPLGPRDRIAAFAEATEAYAESLEDRDLANVYWGKSLGLWQALTILGAADGPTQARQLRGPAALCGPRRADPVGPSTSTRPVLSATAVASQGW